MQPYLANIGNEQILLNKIFLENIRLANVSPIFRKKDKTFAENYRPASVLLTVSKIFERITQKQISDYIGKCLFLHFDVDIEKFLAHNMLY